MKLNLKNTILSVIVLASLVGCGSDGGGGNGAYNYNVNGGISNGVAGAVANATQLSSAIRNNNFGRDSISGNYLFSKSSTTMNSQDCDDHWYGTVCTYSSSSSSSSINNTNYGVRKLLDNGNIERNVFVYGYGNFTFDEDVQYGATLGQLASYLADRVMDARNNGNLYKVINNMLYQYADNMSCVNGDYNCQYIKTADAKVWGVVINGRLNIINLNQSLIEQPVQREYGSGYTAY